MTITIAGFISLMLAILGTSWKLWAHIRTVEKELTNDMTHKLERIEDKIDKLNDKIDSIKG